MSKSKLYNELKDYYKDKIFDKYNNCIYLTYTYYTSYSKFSKNRSYSYYIYSDGDEFVIKYEKYSAPIWPDERKLI